MTIMTPRVWWCSIWRWRARMNQSRTWLLASILASSLFIVAVRANSETGDEKSWQTKAVMRGWAGLGQVEGAHSIMSGGKCLSSPSAASAALQLSQSVLQSSRYVAPVWRCHCGLKISSDHLQLWRTTTEDVTQSQVAMCRHDTWDWD